jgi:hypothetical protein
MMSMRQAPVQPPPSVVNPQTDSDAILAPELLGITPVLPQSKHSFISLVETCKALESIPKSCLETGEIPSAEGLKERLRFMALVQGLDPNISDDVVGFVSQAVEVLPLLSL